VLKLGLNNSRLFIFRTFLQGHYSHGTCLPELHNYALTSQKIQLSINGIERRNMNALCVDPNLFGMCVCALANLTRNTKISYCHKSARYPQLLQGRASSVVNISGCTLNYHSKSFIFNSADTVHLLNIIVGFPLTF